MMIINVGDIVFYKNKKKPMSVIEVSQQRGGVLCSWHCYDNDELITSWISIDKLVKNDDNKDWVMCACDINEKPLKNMVKIKKIIRSCNLINNYNNVSLITKYSCLFCYAWFKCDGNLNQAFKEYHCDSKNKCIINDFVDVSDCFSEFEISNKISNKKTISFASKEDRYFVVDNYIIVKNKVLYIKYN